jgi:hypothetical protein
MKHLLTLALSSCLALAACGSESKTLRPAYEVEELNKQESINALLLNAEKQQRSLANLLLCEKKGKWEVFDREAKTNWKENLGSCSPITCSRVSNTIAGLDGKVPKDRPSGWLCQAGDNVIPQPGIPPNTGGGDNAIPQPGIPPKPGAKPDGGITGIENPIDTDPVPANCALPVNTKACLNGPTFCTADTKSGKTLTTKGNSSSCQEHLVTELKVLACQAKETLDLSTLRCGAPR